MRRRPVRLVLTVPAVLLLSFCATAGCTSRPKVERRETEALPAVAAAREAEQSKAQRQRELNRQLILAAYRGDADEVSRLLDAGAWGDGRFGTVEFPRWPGQDPELEWGDGRPRFGADK